MSKITNFMLSGLKIIMRNRFEPIEVVIAVSSIIHGFWILFPYWFLGDFHIAFSSAPRLVEQFVAALMLTAGVLGTVGVVKGEKSSRSMGMMLVFMGWLAVTALALMASSIASIVWITYLTLALISALIYINVNVGVLHGN